MTKPRIATLRRKQANETNLAAEFHVLSVLHRLGAAAALTLGNKKAVDIVVHSERGHGVTLDVKGAAGTTGFFADNQMKARRRHFVVFVSYLNKIGDPTVSPEIYVVPSSRVRALARTSPSGRSVVSLTSLRRVGSRFKDAWQSVM